jgi:hypothetical protein
VVGVVVTEVSADEVVVVDSGDDVMLSAVVIVCVASSFRAVTGSTIVGVASPNERAGTAVIDGTILRVVLVTPVGVASSICTVRAVAKVAVSPVVVSELSTVVVSAFAS